jgi:hypothetical protein
MSSNYGDYLQLLAFGSQSHNVSLNLQQFNRCDRRIARTMQL